MAEAAKSVESSGAGGAEGPGAKPVHFTQTPEFKNAVEAAVAEQIKEALAQIVPKVAQTTNTADAESLMGALALQIARLSDQGMPEERKRIDPQELERRKKALEEMGAAIMDCRARGVKPQYRATNKSVLNETMINPYYRGKDGSMIPVTFGWDGEPNDCMYPLDEDAVKIFRLFKSSRGWEGPGVNLGKSTPWASAGGVIINSTPPASMREIEVPHWQEDKTAKERFGAGLDLALPNDPNASHVRILGTIAPPATQNNSQGGV
jgi:hypothetical protein